MRIKESFMELSGECVKCVVICKKEVLIVLDPVINFYVFGRHENIADFIFLHL